MDKEPLVSILLLSMNHQAYIENCIKSLQNQTYRNIEIIFLDNASSDNTFQAGKDLLEESNLRHKIFRNEKSKNISQNVNFLFDHASGAFVSPLSADDWFKEDNIEKKISHFMSHPDVGAVFSNGWIYYERSNKTILNDSSPFKSGNIYKDVLVDPGCIFYVGMMYRTEIIQQVGKWDEALKIEDTDMFVRIGLISKIDFIDLPLVYYRKSDNSISGNKSFMLEGYNQYYEKYKHVDWINMKKWLGERYRRVAADFIDQKKNKDAFLYLKVAIKLNPLGIKNIRTMLYLLKNSFARLKLNPHV